MSTQQASIFLSFFCCSVSPCTYTLLLLLPGTTISCRCCCCLVRLKRFRKAGSLSLVLLEWPETLQRGETDRHTGANEKLCGQRAGWQPGVKSLCGWNF